jgi:hypothetical protein
MHLDFSKIAVIGKRYAYLPTCQTFSLLLQFKPPYLHTNQPTDQPYKYTNPPTNQPTDLPTNLA